MTVVLNRAQTAQLERVLRAESHRPDGRLTIHESDGKIIVKADQAGSPQGQYVVTDLDYVWTATGQGAF